MGVGMGMAVALVILLQCNYRNSHFLNMEDRKASKDRHFITMHLAEEVTFLNKGAIKKELAQLPDNCILVIDQSNCVYINHDVAEIISDFIHTASSRGITVEIIERKNKVQSQLSDMQAAA